MTKMSMIASRRFSVQLVCLAVLLGMTTAPVLAQSESDKDGAETKNKRGAIAKVDSTVHNFGEVWTNQSLEHAFSITNTGDETLKILQVKPSCGCTVAGSYPREIKPGDTGKFPFKLNSNKLRGKFSKTISVKTNDPKAGQMRLSLTGTVKHFIEVTPSMAQFGRVDADTVRTKTVKLQNNTDKIMKLTLSSQTPESETFKAELVEVVPGKQYDLNITAQPPFKPKLNRHLIKIDSNLAEHKSVDIICMANYPPRIELQPDTIVVQPVSRDVVRKVRFRNNGAKLVNLVSAKADDDSLKVETKPIEDGKQYELTITIPANYEPPSGSNPVVLVKTDDEEHPELSLPIRAVKKRTAERSQRPAELLRGKPAPKQEFSTFDEKKMVLGGKSDKVKVVAFYASWCGFCKRALPKLQKFHDEYKGKNVEMVLINVDDRGAGRRARTEQQTLEHYKSMNLSIPMHMDNAKSLAPAYKVVSYPTTFVIGKNGIIQDVLMGAKPDLDKQLAKDVDLLLRGETLLSSGAAEPKKMYPNPPGRGGPKAVMEPATGRRMPTLEKAVPKKEKPAAGPKGDT